MMAQNHQGREEITKRRINRVNKALVKTIHVVAIMKSQRSEIESENKELDAALKRNLSRFRHFDRGVVRRQES